MILLIDNYDSFTYNLYQYLRARRRRRGRAQRKIDRGHRGDGTCEDRRLARSLHAYEAGISVPLIKHFAGKRPILGVCLGEQSIGEAFGGKVEYAGEIVHGKTSMVSHDGKGVFAGLPSPFEAIRYRPAIDPEGGFPGRRARDHSHYRQRRHHGRTPPALPDRRRPISPRVHHDA